jgi:hypothetical protein
MTTNRRPLAAALLVTAATLAILWPVTGNGFIDLDDARYLAGNPAATGWTRAFTSLHAANWHPVTWLAHRLLTGAFGLDPFAHHLASLAIHALAAGGLTAAVAMLSGSTLPALLAGALFGWHPLHVESVAWAAQLKDTLAGLFWVATMVAYVAWLRRPNLPRYLATTAFVALATMSKPTAVTLPAALLILDWWPLGRFRPGRLPALLTEKLPWLAMSAGLAAVTVVAQAEGGAVGSLDSFPGGRRLAGATVAAATYLRKTLLPTGLSFFYPHPPAGFPAATIAVCALLMAGFAAAALLLARRLPGLTAGAAWFLVTLLPTLGLIQVGVQAMADRYTYIPLIGLFIGLACSLDPPSRGGRAILAVAFACLVPLACLSRLRAADWRDTVTLAGRATAVCPDNWMALAILGRDAVRRGESGAGTRMLRRAAELEPRDARVWFDFGLALLRSGDPAGGALAFERAAALDPGNAEARAFAAHARKQAARPTPVSR